MRIEVTEMVSITEVGPGELYSDKPQEWWDLTLGDDRIGVVLQVRSEFPVPEAYLGMSTHKIIVHKDQEGVQASIGTHIVDEEPQEDGDPEPAQDEPFHCSSCGGMGTDDGGDPCRSCQGTGVTPRG